MTAIFETFPWWSLVMSFLYWSQPICNLVRSENPFLTHYILLHQQGLSPEPHHSSRAQPCICVHSWLCHRSRQATPTAQAAHCWSSMSIPSFHWFPMTPSSRIQDWKPHVCQGSILPYDATSKKLSDKFLGPYEILALPGTHSVTLWLLDSLNVGTSNSKSHS